LIKDGEVITLTGEPSIQLEALHTPGHARGHLCFHDAERGVLLSGDNIVGLGSVLIDPPEGNMAQYLDSLHRLQKLPNLKLLLGGHGPATASPYQKIAEYITHRLERETNILTAVREGASSPSAVVERVYTDVSPKAYPLAERAVLAHLEKLETEGSIQRNGETYLTV
jgi:glyoxylase-like metal-dependent hydrolase (beta-lactamase superfamily II)